MITISDSLRWISCSTPNIKPYWCDTSRVLLDCPAKDQKRALATLKAGRILLLEAVNMDIEVLPMSDLDVERLRHLMAFERSGFKLTAFRINDAMFSRETPGEYYSMSEMMERTFLPNENIAFRDGNIPIYENGNLIDVFVPVENGPQNFSKINSFEHGTD